MTLEFNDGLLFRRTYPQNSNTSYLQFLVPKKMRTEILSSYHDSTLAGHLGRKKTQGKILQRFYWFELREDVTNWIRACDICAANKLPSKHAKAPLGDMRVGAPMDRLCIDILGPLPETERGNRYIMVITDTFSKWVEAFPIADQQAVTCAQV